MLKRKKIFGTGSPPLQNQPAATCASSQATACTVHKGLPVGSILPPTSPACGKWRLHCSTLVHLKITSLNEKEDHFKIKPIHDVSKSSKFQGGQKHISKYFQLRLGSCLNTVTIKNGFPSLDCKFPRMLLHGGSQESTVGDPKLTTVTWGEKKPLI